MNFFFVQDYKQRYRYFSTEPVHNIQVKFSRLRKLWDKSRKKLMLLPQRTLAQEQAFERVLKCPGDEIQIHHSGRLDEKRLRSKFFFFLQKQRSKHVFLLIGEAILLPVSGLMALLPGPNVFFGVLALLIITHWQALKGINRLLKKEYRFFADEHLGDWEQALSQKHPSSFSLILDKIARKYNLQNFKKILWK